MVTADSTRAIKKDLKKLFPNLKFSVTKNDYSCVHITLLEGDIDFKKFETDRGQTYYESRSNYFSVNEFHIDAHWHGEAKKLFKTILNTIYKHIGRHYNSNAGDMGADYPSWNYHIYLYVGRWNKPYNSGAQNGKK